MTLWVTSIVLVRWAQILLQTLRRLEVKRRGKRASDILSPAEMVPDAVSPSVTSKSLFMLLHLWRTDRSLASPSHAANGLPGSGEEGGNRHGDQAGDQQWPRPFCPEIRILGPTIQLSSLLPAPMTC